MARRTRGRKRKTSLSMPEISLTPLIDMALTLLVIFMITTPMLTNVISIELPTSQSSDKAEQIDKFVIFIDKDEKIFLNGDSVEQDKLLERLVKVVGDHKDQTVIIKGDKAIHYGKLIDIYDTVKHAGGFKYVALATDKS